MEKKIKEEINATFHEVFRKIGYESFPEHVSMSTIVGGLRAGRGMD